MKGFLDRLMGKMAGFMQGRNGADDLSQTLVVCGIVLTLVGMLFGLDLVQLVALALLVYALFRCYSKNTAQRARENEAFRRVVAKPKHQFELIQKRWKNRKTTTYFTCKGCGSVLTVPKGKGTLRVTCPKCHTQVTKKS